MKMNKFIEKNKKLIILCLVVLGVYILSLFFIRNTDLFCRQTDPNVSFQCLEDISFGFSKPVMHLFPYLFSSLLILFFVSDRLKRNVVIAIIAISVPILGFTFNSPVDCGMLCSREDISLFLRNLYPIITILTLIISAIYFYFEDKGIIKKRSLSGYISKLWRDVDK